MSQRRRLLFTFLALLSICLYLFVFSSSDNHNSSIKFFGGFLSKNTKSSVDEIYGLISLVTRESEQSQRVLTTESVDLTQPVDMNVYAAKRGMKWDKELQRLNEEYPVVVFSKTYCPYSRKAKQLLQAYQLSPPPKIIEVDLREDAAQLKTVLTRLTRRSTFPNILLRGKTIGGSDDLHALHNANALRDMFLEAGVDVHMDDM
ncbi:thioredoxin-like protein [Lentinula aff. detonsa]|uniref:Thioredoxin-like protein n=1 Tax=Lentinula aff. detonsa TaxID=2804958 RepID=A0AA38KZU1_9AGAR|nr:thioredoxin-like protein [Lentinula aff. detonsa]KAJ3800249.1 thioredoxin-like protein [Lentinula aff. detonsa]